MEPYATSFDVEDKAEGEYYLLDGPDLQYTPRQQIVAEQAHHMSLRLHDLQELTDLLARTDMLQKANKVLLTEQTGLQQKLTALESDYETLQQELQQLRAQNLAQSDELDILQPYRDMVKQGQEAPVPEYKSHNEDSRAEFEAHRDEWLANQDLPRDLLRLDEQGQLRWVPVKGCLTLAHVAGRTPIAAVGLHESGVPTWIARAKHGLIGYTMIGSGCYFASWGGEQEEFDFQVLDTNLMKWRSHGEHWTEVPGCVAVGLEGHRDNLLHCVLCPVLEDGRRIALIPGRAGLHMWDHRRSVVFGQGFREHWPVGRNDVSLRDALVLCRA